MTPEKIKRLLQLHEQLAFAVQSYFCPMGAEKYEKWARGRLRAELEQAEILKEIDHETFVWPEEFNNTKTGQGKWELLYDDY